MTTPVFGSTPCRACGGSGHIRGLEGACNACQGDGWVRPRPTPAPAPDERPRAPEHVHQSYARIAAAALSDDGYIRALDAVYQQKCICGEVRRNTRLAATIHTLRHKYGWTIETRIPEGRALAIYDLIEEGEWPK